MLDSKAWSVSVIAEVDTAPLQNLGERLAANEPRLSLLRVCPTARDRHANREQLKVPWTAIIKFLAFEADYTNDSRSSSTRNLNLISSLGLSSTV